MRDYQNVERYLNSLLDDIYPQPPDDGHQEMIKNISTKWLSALTGLDSVLDVGCGQGQAIPNLQNYAKHVEGVTLGTDAGIACSHDYTVNMSDMSFLPYRDEKFTLIFARHVLEHSPMPLMALMEWHRVAKQWLLLVLPDPKHYGYIGRNHYYVMNRPQIENLLAVARWRSIWHDDSEKTEIRIFCEKIKA